MVKISTAQFRYDGDDRLDITYKTGDPAFAPTKDLVHRYKDSVINKDQYTQEYIKLMENSYYNNRQRWDRILYSDKVVFVCYCKANSFCHRVILANLFERLGAEYCGEILLFKKG